MSSSAATTTGPIVVVDNYDSFTYNLVQILVTLDERIQVYRNDALSVDDLLALAPRRIVLSPGPGRPESAGICVELLQGRPRVPVLGVCLGHQAIGLAFGGVVEQAPRLMHGKTSLIEHGGRGLFTGVASPFEATRYHSLSVRESDLPEELEPMAWSDDGALMAMRHRQLPYWGVQFHPESILTPDGVKLLSNFMSVGNGADDR